ncbi:MAG: hypothetical protein KKC01_12805 [Gammaproteobacteria bacterium]|nr:hypothetical protein [Gammaproteobacteria bacterium]
MNQHDDQRQQERIQRYLLSAGESADSERLEIEMLDDDELFAQVQIDDMIREGLVTTKIESTAGSIWGMLGVPTRWPLQAVIGLFTLAVVAMGIRMHTLTQQIDRLSGPQVQVPVITLMEQRALADSAQPAAADLQQAILEVDVSAYMTQSFDVTLQDSAGSNTWHGLKADQRGYLTVFVPALHEDVELQVSSADGSFNKTYRLN